MDEHNENFNEEVGIIVMYQTEVTELTHAITELKNARRFNSRLDEAHERMSDRGLRSAELPKPSSKKKEGFQRAKLA